MADRHPVLGTTSALVSASAVAGAVGLATGTLDLTDPVAARLPLGSPVLGGAALAAHVGAPYALLAARSFRGAPSTPATAVVCGGVLLGWIAVEYGFIREFSPLQPAFAVVGAAFVAAGLRLSRRPGPARTRLEVVP